MIKDLNIIKKLKSLLISNTMTQERIDTYRAAATLKFYKQYNNNQYNSGIPSSDQLNQLYKDLDEMTPYALSNYVHTNVYEQIIKIFKTIDFNEKYEQNHNNSYESRNNKRIARNKLINDINSVDDGEKIVDKLNYELIVKKSMIENANDGMFLSMLDNHVINNQSESSNSNSDSISGNSSNDSSDSSNRFIIPGTVIGFYPGQVYLKSHLLQSPSILTNLLPDDDFMLMTRYDECIIDGRTAHTLPTHPYALCHKINHCGLTKPNVMQVYNNYNSMMYVCIHTIISVLIPYVITILSSIIIIILLLLIIIIIKIIIIILVVT